MAEKSLEVQKTGKSQYAEVIFLREWMKPIQKYIQDFEKEKLGANAPDPALREFKGKTVEELYWKITGEDDE